MEILKQGAHVWNEWWKAHIGMHAPSSSDLYGADLSKADLRGLDLTGIDLYNANLSNARLSNAILFRANLSKANLIRAKLVETSLVSANLSRANIENANLNGKYSLMKRYEIIGTLGAASDVDAVWISMLAARATAFRMNTSHLELGQLLKRGST